MWHDIEKIKQLITNSINKTDILNKLGLKNHGGNYNTLTRFIRINKIDITHFNINKLTKERKTNTNDDINDILVENSTYASTNHLKEKLYKIGLKHKNCELCGQSEEWMGKKMSLILDHINGDRHDNRIENLQIVCANCNATLDTHCRGLNANKEKKHIKYDQCKCGGTKQKKSELCISCHKEKLLIIREAEKDREKKTTKERRKVERPTYEVLIKEVKELGYVGVGRKYGLSDNGVRKWKKMYEKYGIDF